MLYIIIKMVESIKTSYVYEYEQLYIGACTYGPNIADTVSVLSSDQSSTIKYIIMTATGITPLKVHNQNFQFNDIHTQHMQLYIDHYQICFH